MAEEIEDAIDFKKFFNGVGKITKQQMKNITQTLSMDAFDSVMEESGKDTGYLRSNWQLVVDVEPDEEVLKKPKQPKRKKVKGKKVKPVTYKNAKRGSTAKVRHDSVVTLYNNTEYAIYLEEGTPTNRAQPMIKPTKQMVEEAAKKLTADLSKEKID